MREVSKREGSVQESQVRLTVNKSLRKKYKFTIRVSDLKSTPSSLSTDRRGDERGEVTECVPDVTRTTN